MTWITEAECDVCHERKRVANHWFEVHVDQSGELMVSPMAGVTEGIEHICGQKCLHTRLDQWVAQTATTLTEGADHNGNTSQS
jgi:hypothetical protein